MTLSVPTSGDLRLPLAPRPARAVVLFAVFACAACGLVYELALVSLGSYLIGDTVAQASIVLSVMVFAMGVGSLAAKRLQRWPIASFAVVEALLALTGGLSMVALYGAFAWLDLYQPALVVAAFVIGALIGAEIPILMTLIQRIREQDPGEAVADLFAADYVGALVGGLAFPFVLLPRFGQLQGSVVVALVNVAAALALVVWLFRHTLRAVVRRALTGVLLAVSLLLVGTLLVTDRFEASARQVLFDDPIVHSERTRYQEIVLTESFAVAGTRDLRLFLNGDLQFSSIDEYRYHEALVHPAMAGRRDRVLILGGGDGLALREVLRYDDVRTAVVVELDPAVIRLAREDRRVARLNGGSFDDGRVDVVTEDAFSWLRGYDGPPFDVVIADFPDADSTATAKLYSVELYGMIRSRALAPSGRFVVQSGSPYFAPDVFWCIEATLQAAGFATAPYQADVPTFGPWGYFLAGRAATDVELRVDPPAGRLRYLTPELLQASSVFPADRARRDVEPSTLSHPRVMEYARRSWQDY